MSVRILVGSALDVLKTLPDESVQCVVTSPPYFGLRAYGTEPQVWGGDPSHDHAWDTVPSPGSRSSDTKPGPLQHPGNKHRERLTSDLCGCGAWRGELGLEPTPALFIEHLLMIFREVKRVLRTDGLLFVNLSDSYNAGRNGGHPGGKKQWKDDRYVGQSGANVPGLKPKSLMLVPQRFAIAMQDDGWIVRSQIAWCKTSAMPESVKDRPTSAWEPIWMFSKSAKYFYDADAVRQPAAPGTEERLAKPWNGNQNRDFAGGPQNHLSRYFGSDSVRSGANLRNFWLLGPQPSSLEHYAGYPPELPKRCILAGTSEKGACPECGAPWARVVERKPDGRPSVSNPKQGALTQMGTRGDGFSSSRVNTPEYGHAFVSTTRSTGEWQPSCSCDAGPPRPCLVLDPFLGSGTTLMVASRFGRDGIGIELNESYARMAAARIDNDAPLLSEPVSVAGPAQLALLETGGTGR